MADKREGYKNIQKQYRKQFLELLEELEGNYQDISEKLKNKIRNTALDYAKADGTFSKADIDRIKRELSNHSSWLASEMKDFLDENIKESASIAIRGQDDATEYLLQQLASQEGIEKLVDNALQGVNDDSILLQVRYGNGLQEQVRQAVWNSRWADDSKKLSDRIWDIKEYTDQGLQDMIEQSVNQGKSAAEFSRAVEEFLEESGPSWTTGIKPSVTGRGSIDYNALRLARSETQNAYRRSQKLSAQKSTVTKAIKWNLSNSHPTYPPSYSYKGYNEICNYMAEDNHHNLGAGVYPPDEIPITPHPQCMCYWTDVLYKDDELINKLKEKYS